MTEPAGPTAARPGWLPTYLCMPPCTNAPVRYLDRFDGCASGLHFPWKELFDLEVSVYGRMADELMAFEDCLPPPLQEGTTTPPEPCTVCHVPLVPSATFPVIYMENCAHSFHYGCVPRYTMNACPQCNAPSCRGLLWPENFPTAASKNDTFQLQKCSFGLDVAPQTQLEMEQITLSEFPSFWITFNSMSYYVSKRRRDGRVEQIPLHGNMTRSSISVSGASNPTVGGSYRSSGCPPKPKDPEPRYRCPQGVQCALNPRDCGLWHGTGWTKLGDLPRFYCVRNLRTRPPGPECTERIRVTEEDLDRCLAGYHSAYFGNVNGFARKMVKRIMAPVVPVPDRATLVCAQCRNQAQPPEPLNSVRLHLENCNHWLHVHCLPLARQASATYPKLRKLDLICLACQMASLRTIAWPGLFKSDLMKQTAMNRQRVAFKFSFFQADTQLLIVQVADQVNTFTVDFGGPSVVTIDASVPQANLAVHYD